jgi:hypothetical protein
MTYVQQRRDFVGDPLADNVIARIVGEWNPVAADSGSEEAINANAAHWQCIAQVNRVIATWTDNSALARWENLASVADADVVAELKAFVEEAKQLPPWADAKKIARAEALFMGAGPLSVSLLFCASLPECYVVPDLASVLHTTGQLDSHADYRVRATGAMIFPVMMPGGLTTENGGGIAQVLKVRLIHATIRNLILRGNPEAVVGGGPIEPHLALAAQSNNMHHSLFARGWNTAQKGVPCNQEELAYTLLTFGYVYLRGMRTLGLGFTRDDDEAFLHAWNVMGHVLGIERDGMADTMHQAETSFRAIQARSRANRVTPDVRPRLGEALMTVMENEVPFGLLKGVPVLLTRYLCGSENARDIGVNERVGLLTRALFATVMALTRTIDTVVRFVAPSFSITGLLTRILGERLLYKVLMDLARPLQLPSHLMARVAQVASVWRGET